MIWFWVWHWPIITQLKLFVLQHSVGGKKVYCIATLSIHTSPESYISTFQPVAREKLGTETERETLCQLMKVDILKRTLFMKQEHCIVIV